MSLDDLRDLYRDSRVMPFIGAGVSMAVQWTDPASGSLVRSPSWTELVNQAAKELGFDDPDLLRQRGEDIQILEYYNAKMGSLQPLTNWLVKLLSPPDGALQASALHTELSALTKCRTYYTTNYDDFLERSLQLGGRDVHPITTELHMANSLDKPSDTVVVVKFHGDFGSPEKMVVSEKHYYNRIRLEDELDKRLLSDLMGRAVLFIGYSFRDWNVAYLFNTVNQLSGDLPHSESGRRAYIMVPYPSRFEKELFKSRNIEVIPLEQPDIAAAIADKLKYIRS